jgi:hypothetical protein
LAGQSEAEAAREDARPTKSDEMYHHQKPAIDFSPSRVFTRHRPGGIESPTRALVSASTNTPASGVKKMNKRFYGKE